MSFLATLQLGNKEFRLLHCEYRFVQNTDSYGKPSAPPKGGKIFLSLESNESLDFFDWMISESAKKSGKITFARRDGMSKMKQLEFTDAFCIYYKEKFSSSGTMPMRTEVELAARTITIGNAAYENPRPL